MFMHGLLQGILNNQGTLTEDAAMFLIIFFVGAILFVVLTTNRHNY